MNTQLVLLKQILSNLQTPERLDSHPWVDSLTVRETAANDPCLTGKNPGTQLVMTVGRLFRELRPASPPRQTGKRLDTRWGRFGILAANYFAPLLYGRNYPHSMREAWRKIDQAVLFFVYDTPASQLNHEQVQTYRLIGDEPDMPANSTISDWHHKGLQDLVELFFNHERHLRLSSGVSTTAPDGERKVVTPELKTGRRGSKQAHGRGQFATRISCALPLIGMLALMIIFGVKGWQVYRSAQSVRTDIRGLQNLNISTFNPGTLEQLGPQLNKTHEDIETLRGMVSPWLWLTPRLGWVPVYGGDIKFAGDFLEMGSDLTSSASQTYGIILPIWQSIHQSQSDLRATELSDSLLKAQPALSNSRLVLERAILTRQQIDINTLSPATRALLVRADSYISAFNDGLSLALSLPTLMGGSKEGPKTYLILVQNEDELRATGGFITAVGKLVVWNGKLISWNIADSYSVDDINKAYPIAPWQMNSFMNIPIMTFRDSNWSPDFPTTVMWAEYLYAYSNSYSVNGVIAIDQHVLKMLLSVTGPIYVSEINTTVNIDNIQSVMRAQKVPPSGELQDPAWYRKHFLNPIAAAVLERILSGKGFTWEVLIRDMLGDLDQRHILIELDDPTFSKVLATHGWDGGIVRNQGDFLMVVDTNVGYNKTNAVVTESLSYDIDLSSPSTPTSRLAVFHDNAAKGPDGECNQWPAGIDPSTVEYWYAIDRCYYNYLRVYIPDGSRIKNATPHAVTRDEMIMLDQDVPARVDHLDENFPGLQGFGTLELVHMGGSLETDFQYSLPVSILQTDPGSGDTIYQLKVQKQAGTEAVPITIRVHLPIGSTVSYGTPNGYAQNRTILLFSLVLTTDVNVKIQFHP